MFFRREESKTILGSVYEQFVESAPVAVMVRGTMERCLGPETIDRVFGESAHRQYNKQLLFSKTFEILTETVCKVHPSVRAAYQAHQPEVEVSVTALYDKLKGTEPGIAAGLVRHTAGELGPLIREIGGLMPAPLPGHPTRIVDGSCIASTERRPKVLHPVQDEPLPGKALVVLDPEPMLVLEMIPCEDGHAQERVLLPALLELVQARELWMGDRNLCTLVFRVADITEVGGGLFHD
jgi:hypothetical protein